MTRIFILSILTLSILFSNIFADEVDIEELTELCKQNNAEICKVLGDVYLYSHEKDLKKAFHYYHKACNLGLATGCYQVGILYLSKDKHKKSFDYLLRACHMGFGLGCNSVGVFYAKGIGRKKNLYKAKVFYKKACNLNAGKGCSNLGVMYITGKAGEKDEAKAEKLFIKACNLNDKEGCYNLGVLYYNKYTKTKDSNYWRKALPIFSKSCKLGFKKACSIKYRAKK